MESERRSFTERLAPSGHSPIIRMIIFLAPALLNAWLALGMFAYACWLTDLHQAAQIRKAKESFEYRVAAAERCVADVLVVEVANVNEPSQRRIADLVIHRTPSWGIGRSWLDQVCDSAFAKHKNANTGAMVYDFSGVIGRGPDFDFPSVAGWQQVGKVAHEAIFTALNPAQGLKRYGYVPLDPEYVFFFSEPVEIAGFEKANNHAVCDQFSPYDIQGGSFKWLTLCKKSVKAKDLLQASR